MTIEQLCLMHQARPFQPFDIHGHDVATVYEQGLRGRDDSDIAEACRSEGRVLISLDLDFSDIQAFPPENYPGLIVLRLRSKGRGAVQSVFLRVISHLQHERISGRLWIVDEHRIRVHRVRNDED
jgi:predicted nuclease of predicted toxin-antitoxin system